jgi:hypothetical protein
LFPNLS